MSRAFGDVVCREFGVVCEPEVREIEIQERDLFIMLCSDGVWEFVSNEEALGFVSKKGRGKVKQSCEQVVEMSFNRWLENEGNTVDDITCIVVYV